MYRCNRVVCDRRHAGVHHVQHGDALYVQGEKEEAKRAQAQEQALLNTFKYKEGDEVKGYIIYPSRVCRCRTSARQKATCRSTQWCLITTPITARYRLRLRSKSRRPQSAIYPQYYKISGDVGQGHKTYTFVYDGDIDYDLNNPEEVKSNVLTLDEVDRYFKD